MSLDQPHPISAPDLQLWLQGEAPSPQVVDVREAQELAMAKFPRDVLHLPLSASSEWIATLQSRLAPGPTRRGAMSCRCAQPSLRSVALRSRLGPRGVESGRGNRRLEYPGG
jgi:rhodanese-related sulfurtransferase